MLHLLHNNISLFLIERHKLADQGVALCKQSGDPRLLDAGETKHESFLEILDSFVIRCNSCVEPFLGRENITNELMSSHILSSCRVLSLLTYGRVVRVHWRVAVDGTLVEEIELPTVDAEETELHTVDGTLVEEIELPTADAEETELPTVEASTYSVSARLIAGAFLGPTDGMENSPVATSPVWKEKKK
jgi:hypothetical protein